MPIPLEDESEDDFVARCIPMVLEEDKNRTHKQAVGRCMGMYEYYHNKQKEA